MFLLVITKALKEKYVAFVDIRFAHIKMVDKKQILL